MIAAHGTRVVHVEPYSVNFPAQDFVLPDYRQAGQTAAATLMLAGYRNFVFAHMSDSPFERLIEAGFAQALHDQGRSYNPDVNRYRVPDLHHKPELLSALEKEIRQMPPSTGILCRTPDNALIIQRLLRQQGRDIPGDVGLITVQCSCEPACETVDTLLLDRRLMLQKAVDHIIGGRGRRLRQLEAPQFVRRGSVRSGGA
jgi:DNA-binding LacI/PurR family transcriptional regulator